MVEPFAQWLDDTLTTRHAGQQFFEETRRIQITSQRRYLRWASSTQATPVADDWAVAGPGVTRVVMEANGYYCDSWELHQTGAAVAVGCVQAWARPGWWVAELDLCRTIAPAPPDVGA